MMISLVTQFAFALLGGIFMRVQLRLRLHRGYSIVEPYNKKAETHPDYGSALKAQNWHE